LAASSSLEEYCVYTFQRCFESCFKNTPGRQEGMPLVPKPEIGLRVIALPPVLGAKLEASGNEIYYVESPRWMNIHMKEALSHT